MNTNYRSKVVAVGTSETELLPRDDNRYAVLLFNQGDQTVSFYFEDNSAAYFSIAAGTGIELPIAAMNQINAVAASGSQNVTIMWG